MDSLPVPVLLRVRPLGLQLEDLLRSGIQDVDLLLGLVLLHALVDDHLLVLLGLLQYVMLLLVVHVPVVLLLADVLVDDLDLRVHAQDVVNKVPVNLRHRIPNRSSRRLLLLQYATFRVGHHWRKMYKRKSIIVL